MHLTPTIFIDITNPRAITDMKKMRVQTEGYLKELQNEFMDALMLNSVIIFPAKMIISGTLVSTLIATRVKALYNSHNGPLLVELDTGAIVSVSVR